MITAIVLIMNVTAINAMPDSQLYIKNNTSWDIKIKFAEPSRMNAAETPIRAGGVYPLGAINNMYDIRYLSVMRYGRAEFMSGWTELDLNYLKQDSQRQLNEKEGVIPGYEKDIYWTILPTATGWTAKVVNVQTKK